jgi:hypothetical protein
MKALSIRQPWSWLIINAGKDIENRCWRTHFRGRFLVHASGGCTRGEYDDACEDAASIGATMPPPYEQIERGGIIGSVELVDCVTDSNSEWFRGQYGFVLRNPQPLPFRPYKGMLSFFEVGE